MFCCFAVFQYILRIFRNKSSIDTLLYYVFYSTVFPEIYELNHVADINITVSDYSIGHIDVLLLHESIPIYITNFSN